MPDDKKEDTVVSALIITQLVLELLALVARAIEAGTDISEEKIQAAFDRAGLANADWAAFLADHPKE